MVNLQQFCSTDPERPYLDRPWSRGEFTYATNGHILARVPRVADIEERSEAPDATKVTNKVDFAVRFDLVALVDLPPSEMMECVACDGRGTEHDCESCECICLSCSGAAEVPDDIDKSVGIHDVPFAMTYARKIFALPGLALPIDVLNNEPMPFKFDGGEGVWMPRMLPQESHFVVLP